MLSSVEVVKRGIHTKETLDQLASELKLAVKEGWGRTDEVALELLREIPGFDGASLYLYKRLNEESIEYGHILKYVENSQDQRFRLKIADVIKVIRDGEQNLKDDPKKQKKLRLMLWHGTKKDYVGSILKSGFLRPNSYGQMFGNGIYFADRICKSARYCFSRSQPADPAPGSTAYLLLCDVLVGSYYNAKNPHPEFSDVPKLQNKNTQFDSVKCTGELIPDLAEQIEFDGTKWPIGKTVKNTKFSNYTLHYNEFIVYNPSAIKIKYIVKVQIN